MHIYHCFQIVTASWLNAVGAGIRAVSCMNVPHVWQFPLLLGGQTLCGLAQPFVMVAPTKLAALWFPADQRALANTMGTICKYLWGHLNINVLTMYVPQQGTDSE